MSDQPEQPRKWMVCPWYATGSSMNGTRRHVWQALPAPAGAHTDFWGTTAVFATQEEAERAADRRTEDNDAF